MARWTSYLSQTFGKLRERLKGDDPDALEVLPYLGYGTRERFYLLGRVLEARDIPPASADASAWENLLHSYRRFESDEEPGALLRARFGPDERVFRSDAEGYLGVWLELSQPLAEPYDGLQTLELELLKPRRARQRQTRFALAVLVPSPAARFGVISDLDDTVLQTGATSLPSMMSKVLFGNAHTRLPFEGVAGFYRALQGEHNPIFYVSSSPWNLYDLLVEFLELSDIPAGPLLLRDWGLDPLGLLRHGSHKLENIERILNCYPELPFLLIGDSGQEDPEIYAQVLRDFPGRILGVYIRDVSRDAERTAQIRALGAEALAAGAYLELVADTLAAARHAASRGLLEPGGVHEVAQAKRQDEAKEPAEGEG